MQHGAKASENALWRQGRGAHISLIDPHAHSDSCTHDRNPTAALASLPAYEGLPTRGCIHPCVVAAGGEPCVDNIAYREKVSEGQGSGDSREMWADRARYGEIWERMHLRPGGGHE